MYTLYYSPHACSLATHTILNMLGLETKLVFSGGIDNFAEVNPVKAVPALKDGEKVLTEGAAIILHLLNKHDNDLLPQEPVAQQQAIENMMLANATMHPAYGRLFFAANNIQDESAKTAFFNAAAESINQIWSAVESKIQQGAYLGGSTPSAADVLLATYSRWGQYFPVDIKIGAKAQYMIDLVLANPAFKAALEQQEQDQKAYA